MAKRRQQTGLPPLPIQEQLWLMQQMAPDVGVANISSVLEWHGPLDVLSLQAATADFVCRHPWLRTRVEPGIDGRLRQTCEGPQALPITVIDLQHLDGEALETERERVIGKLAEKPLERDLFPNIRLVVVRTSPRRHDVLVVFSHMTCDGISTGIVCKESLQAYEARLAGREPSWIGEFSDRLVIELTENASPDRDRRDGERQSRHLPENKSMPIELPGRSIPTGPPRWRGKRLTFEVPDGASEKLNTASLQSGVSPFVTWMSILQIVLSRHSGQQCFPVDIVRGGRTSGQRRCVGPFFAMARRNLDLEPSTTFASLLARNKKIVDDMNAEGPYERPLPSTRSAFLIDYQAELPSVRLADGTLVIPHELDNGAATAELCFGIRRNKRRFTGHVKFDTDLYDMEYVRQLVDHVLVCLDKVLADPSLRIEAIDFRTADEIEMSAKLSRPSGVAMNGTGDGHVMSFDEQIVAALAESNAFAIGGVGSDESWSGRQLVEATRQISARLIRSGVQRHDRVGILMPAGPTSVAAMLAVAQCGAAWVPIDPQWPQGRIQEVVDRALLGKLLTTRTLSSRAPGPRELTLVVDDENAGIGPDARVQGLPALRSLDDTAYVIFTSGSTGKPKGVEVTHRNLLNFFHGINTLDHDTGRSRWLAATSISFDISLLELLWPLTRGSEIHVADRGIVLSDFSGIVRERKITHFQCTPSLMQMLVSAPGNLDSLARLERVYIGGEALPQPLADLVSGLACQVFNMYGPTETTVWSTSCQVRSQQPVSIGRPLAGQGILVLDPFLRPLPFNLTGELFIGGDSVARGYFDDAELTREKFINHPVYGPLFRTGDLVQLKPDGNLVFVGRSDEQIKLHGHRIEPADIDAKCLAFPGVRQAATVLVDRESGPRLWTFVVASSGLDLDELRRFLGSQLPAAMVPSYFRLVEAIPLLSSGKADRQELKKLASRSGDADPSGSDSGPTPQCFQRAHDSGGSGWDLQRLNQLVELVQEELHLEALPLEGSWSDLEIHSLDVAGLVVRAEKSLGISIAVADLFSNALIRKTLHDALGIPLAPVDVAPAPMQSAGGPDCEPEADDADIGSQQEQDEPDTSSGFDHLTRALEAEPDEPANRHPYAMYVEPVKSRLLARVGLDMAFVRGEGLYLEDAEGNRYLDCIAQYGGLPFGSNPPQIWSALESVRARQVPNVATQSMLDTAGELAQRLLGVLPGSFKHVVFCNSGAEATEVAIKLCRAATGRRGILSTKTGFHGLTSGALPVTGNPGFRDGFLADSHDFSHVPYGDDVGLERELDRRADFYAAFVVEPVQGEAGILLPPDGYLSRVRELCDAFGVLMVVDEVQTGLGRTGKMFGFEHESAIPDVVMIAKALGGGLIPCGAVACQPAAWTTRFGLRHSSTFAGNAMASACGIATLDLLERDGRELVEHVRNTGEYLLARLQDLRHRFPDFIAEVRGRGLMLALEFDFRSLRHRDGLMPVLVQEQLLMHLVVSYLLHQSGIRVAPAFNGRTTLRIEPPLTFGKTESELLIKGLHDVLGVLDRGDCGLLVSPMTGARGHQIRQLARQGTTVNWRKQRMETERDPVEADGEFGFLVHLSDVDDLVRFDSSLGIFNRQQLVELKRRFSGSAEPVLVGEDLFRSTTGRVARGKFVLLPFTPAELMAMPRDRSLQLVESAAIRAMEENVRLIGLGGFTSILSAGGLALDSGRLPCLTSGNALTVAASMQAIEHACSCSGMNLAEATVAVIGAGGQIGRAMTELLLAKGATLILIGRPGNERRTRHQLQSVVRSLASDCVRSGKIVLGAGVEDIAAADVVVAASSAVVPFIGTEHLKLNAIVCDLSRPANVLPDVRAQREDVRLIEGGLIRPVVPFSCQLFAGPRSDALYACVAESALWVLEPELGLPSAVERLDTRLIRQLGDAANKHGFEVLFGDEPVRFGNLQASLNADG